MITGLGKGAAYLRNTDTGIDFKDPQKYQDIIKANQKEKGLDLAAKQKAVEERKKDYASTWGISDEDFVAELSQIDTYDDVIVDYAKSSADQYNGFYRQAQKYREQGNLRDASIIEDRMRKIKNNFSNANQLSKTILEKKKRFDELQKAGKLSPADADYASHILAVGDIDMKVKNDDNGIPHITMWLKDPDNPDDLNKGKRVEMKVSDYRSKYKPAEVYDVDNWIKEEAGKYNLEVETDMSGEYKVVTKDLGDRAKAAISAQIDALTKGDTYMTHLLHMATGGKENKRVGVGGVKEFTETDRKKVREYLKARALGKYDKQVEKSANTTKEKDKDRQFKKDAAIRKEDADKRLAAYKAQLEKEKLDYKAQLDGKEQKDAANTSFSITVEANAKGRPATQYTGGSIAGLSESVNYLIRDNKDKSSGMKGVDRDDKTSELMQIKQVYDKNTKQTRFVGVFRYKAGKKSSPSTNSLEVSTQEAQGAYSTKEMALLPHHFTAISNIEKSKGADGATNASLVELLEEAKKRAEGNSVERNDLDISSTETETSSSETSEQKTVRTESDDEDF